MHRKEASREADGKRRVSSRIVISKRRRRGDEQERVNASTTLWWVSHQSASVVRDMQFEKKHVDVFSFLVSSLL